MSQLLKSESVLTDDPCSTTSVLSIHGKPKPSKMSNILLPIELDTAMSPIPDTHTEEETLYYFVLYFCSSVNLS